MTQTAVLPAEMQQLMLITQLTGGNLHQPQAFRVALNALDPEQCRQLNDLPRSVLGKFLDALSLEQFLEVHLWHLRYQNTRLCQDRDSRVQLLKYERERIFGSQLECGATELANVRLLQHHDLHHLALGQAIERVESKVFNGHCLGCGQPIPRQRLWCVPVTEHCMVCKKNGAQAAKEN